MLYRTLLKFWLLPPMLNILLIMLGLLLLARYRRLGIACCTTGLLSLLLLSIPQFSNGLLQSTEVANALDAKHERSRSADAIVVLGAGHLEFATEYGDAQPSNDGVARLSYAAYLHSVTGLPLMLTGGQPAGSEHVHAQVLARYLQRNYGLMPRWIEGRSRTTEENAINAAAVLLPQQLGTVLLVTQSMHMRRSIHLFEAAGFNVIPAPTELAFASSPAAQAWRWIPTAQALHNSSMVIHEILGYWWYRLCAFR